MDLLPGIETAYKAALANEVVRLTKELARLGIDNWHEGKRVDNSRLKHLGTRNLTEAETSALEAYLAHLRRRRNGKD